MKKPRVVRGGERLAGVGRADRIVAVTMIAVSPHKIADELPLLTEVSLSYGQADRGGDYGNDTNCAEQDDSAFFHFFLL